MGAARGLSFLHTHGGCGGKLFVEQLGSGCAFLDYDDDGWQDILLLRGAPLPGCSAPDPRASSVVLYRNEGGKRFVNVTESAGLHISVHAIGCSVGDYDNDGFPDLYITCWGRNLLFHNEGGRKFTERGRQVGIAGSGMSASCAWLDYDNDGWLDLYVCRYVDWSPERDFFCGRDGNKAYCPPAHYPAETNLLFHNNRNGTFTEVSASAGVAGPGGRSLGVVATDLDDDNRPDLFVANDGTPNFLFRNLGNGKFEDISIQAGIATPATAIPKGGMGVDVADLEGTGRPDIAIGNLHYESLTLFRNSGQGFFEDVAFPRGLGEVSANFLTWSLFFFDVDLDGASDLFAANGHIQENIAETAPGVTYRERPFLFRNTGKGSFAEMGAAGGLLQPLTARGASWGDFDNDGRPDMLINNIHERACLLQNSATGTANHWLKLRLKGTRSNRSGIGAKITVESAGRRQVTWVRSGSGYCSQSDLRPNIGLGSAAFAERVTVRWPSGRVQDLGRVNASRILDVVEP